MVGFGLRRGLASRPLGEAVQQRRLGRQDAFARLVEPEPPGPVDLRELAHPARPRRPLDREGVRADRRGVGVALERPRRDDLAAALAHLAEIDELAVGWRGAELLRELAQRARARVLVVLVLALR